MGEHPGTSTAGATEQRPQVGASWMSSNWAASMYAAVLMATSGGIVWAMAGAPDSTAKNWLILAVVIWAWLAGVQESNLTTPFIPLAIGAAGMAFASRRRWPEPAEPHGFPQHRMRDVAGPGSAVEERD